MPQTKKNSSETFKYTVEQYRIKQEKMKARAVPRDVQFKDFKDFRIYMPFQNKGKFPTLLYIPGNAFVASEIEHTHFICSHIAKLARCQVIVLRHKLAPEFKWPVGINDIRYTLRMLGVPGIAEALNIDRKRTALAGYSSGGNLAALLAMRADRITCSMWSDLEFKIVRQILISPVTDISRAKKGFEGYEHEDKVVTEQFVKWFLDLYIAENVNRRNPRLSPYWANKAALASVPPTDIIFGEYDRFRGDSQAYGKKLKDNGTKTCLFMFKKENHALLWNNMKVVQTISSRLMASFDNTPMPSSLASMNQDKCTVTWFNQKQNHNHNCKKRPKVSNFSKTIYKK